jgi:hypothetical protein
MQDEKGAVAVLSVELDEVLQGAAKQYREVQGAESPEFRQVRSPYASQSGAACFLAL